MQHDEAIWQVIGNNGFCSYKAKTKTQTFCRNPYNLTGLCSRKACPLSNSRYATVLEKEGVLYLYVKVVERAHSPKSLWEKIKLPKNYAAALKEIDEQLQFWPHHIIHKCKQRLTKIHQFLLRSRKLMNRRSKALVPIKKKLERRDATREAKALTASKLTDVIKGELLDRLQKGAYGEIYNFPQQMYEEALDYEAEEVEEDESIEYVEAYDSEIESENEMEDTYNFDMNRASGAGMEIEYETMSLTDSAK